jgi:hypothetical protein
MRGVREDSRVARFFFVQHTKTGKNIPKWPQNAKWPWNTPQFSIPRPSLIYQNGTFVYKYTKTTFTYGTYIHQNVIFWYRYKYTKVAFLVWNIPKWHFWYEIYQSGIFGMKYTKVAFLVWNRYTKVAFLVWNRYTKVAFLVWNIPKWHFWYEIYQSGIFGMKYTKVAFLLCKYTRVAFLLWKYTIWQPWSDLFVFKTKKEIEQVTLCFGFAFRVSTDTCCFEKRRSALSRIRHFCPLGL